MLNNKGEVCHNQIGTYGFEAKREKERFTVVCRRQNLKVGHFTLLFWQVRERNVQKCLPHEQHDPFGSFNPTFKIYDGDVDELCTIASFSRLGHLVRVVQCGWSILKINWYKSFQSETRDWKIHNCTFALFSKPQIFGDFTSLLCRVPHEYETKCVQRVQHDSTITFSPLTKILGPFIREKNKPRLTLAAAYVSHERNYLYEYKLPGQDNPRLEKAVNVDFVPFIRGFRGLRKPRLIFSRISGPIVVSWRSRWRPRRRS